MKLIYTSESLKTADDYNLVKTIAEESNKNKQEAAFNEFYNRYYNSLWISCVRICSHYSKDKNFVDDIFQETVIKAYKKINTFFLGKLSSDITEEKIKAWLNRIASNTFLDYIRGNSNQKNNTIEYNEELHDAEDTVEVEENENFNQMRLESAIEKLPQKERDILYHFMHNTNSKKDKIDLEKIAKKYNIKDESARRTYFRIIKKFQKEFS